MCDDATFVRRAFLDAVGTLPTPEQTQAFLDDKSPTKRAALIDALLGLTGDPAKDVHNNAYAAYWSLKWADLIRSSSDTVGEQGMWAMHNWIQDSFRQNKPYDKFVRELVMAKGSIYMDGRPTTTALRSRTRRTSRNRRPSSSSAFVCNAQSATITRWRSTAKKTITASRRSCPRRHEEQSGVRAIRPRASRDGEEYGGCATSEDRRRHAADSFGR